MNSTPFLSHIHENVANNIKQFTTALSYENQSQENINKLKRLAWCKISSNAKVTTGININISGYTTINSILNCNINDGGLNMYNTATTSQIKYSPKPYIQSIEIANKGEKLSLIEAIVTIVAYTDDDLEKIELLYSNPKVSVFIEYGYSTNNGISQLIDSTEAQTLFSDISNKIEEKTNNSGGDYGVLIANPIKWNFNNLDNKYTITITYLSSGISDIYKISEKNNNDSDKIINNCIFSHAGFLEWINSQSINDVSSEDFKKISDTIGFSTIRNKWNTPVKSYYYFNIFEIISTFNEYFDTFYIDLKYNDYIENNPFCISKNSFNVIYNNDTTSGNMWKESQQIVDDWNAFSEITNVNILYRDIYVNLRTWINEYFEKFNTKTTWIDIINTLIDFIQQNLLLTSDIKLIKTTNKINNKIVYQFVNKKIKSANIVTTKTPIELKVSGKESIVENFSLTGEISNELASWIAFSNEVNVNGTIGKFWKNIDDKYVNYEKIEIEKQNNIQFNKEVEKEIEKTTEKLKIDLRTTLSLQIQYTNSVLSSQNKITTTYTPFSSTLIKYIEQIIDSYYRNEQNDLSTSQIVNNCEVLFPLKLSIDFAFGNSGFYYGKLFQINRLPQKYKDAGCFFVTGVKHSIKDTTWKTSIEANFIPYTQINN